MVLTPLLRRAWARTCVLVTIALVAALTTAPAAHATVISGESEGFGLDMGLSIPGFSVAIDEAGSASGSGGSPYSNSNSVVGLGATVGPLVDLSTAAVSGNASSDIDGGAGSRTVNGKGTIDTISLEVIPGSGLTPTLLELSATVIEGDATVSGDFGALTATGATTLTGLAISVAGTSLSIPISPAPNTVLFSGGGLEILLNEQSITGDGISTADIAVNAVRITFDDAGASSVNGEITLGHASAAATAVPEPASMSLLLLGTGVMLFRRRQHRIQTA